MYPNLSKPNMPLQPVEEDSDSEENNNSSGCNKTWCWWSPRQNTLPVAFCNETSIHGFKFLGQEKRHISERIFWMVGFFLSLATAIYLIYGVYSRYKKVPVIVSFQSNEQGMSSIPFPAVTLCNMNKFPKSKVEQLQKIASDPTHQDHKKAAKQLIFVRNACNAQQSFAKEFDFAFSRGVNKKGIKKNSYSPNKAPASSPENETTLTEADQQEMTDFLLRNTLTCDQLIRLCMLGEEKQECGKLFKPIITNYGKCCTFNILPLPLLLRDPDHGDTDDISSLYKNPVLGSDAQEHWPEEELRNWSTWNYEDGFVLGASTTRPWRQKRAGLPYGLSLLLDPNVDDYFCPASDSLGIRYILHTPLEMPHVMEFSSVADLEKEILIEVHPDVTNADDDIRNVEPNERLCLFGRERTLRFFRPYTGGNCEDECTADYLRKRCNCTLFYMPRDDGVRICDSDPDSRDASCTDKARMNLQQKMKEECSQCETLCEDIAYNYETTIADMQENSALWGDPNPAYHGNTKPDWKDHKMAVVHIFFGAESTVPKFRKRLYGTTDLIANTGGILGLCLGFSILSGVEVLYFFTLRAFWKFCRKRKIKKEEMQQREKRTNGYIASLLFHKGAKDSNKVIQLNPNKIPVYPKDDIGLRAGQGWGNSMGHHFYGHSLIQPGKVGYNQPSHYQGYSYN